MQALEILIRAVRGVTQAVVSQSDDLIARCNAAIRVALILRRISAAAVLINIVAQMHRKIDIIDLGCMGIGIEIAKAEVRAGENRHSELRCRPFGQCARASNG